ncbi:MAG: Na+/H+ antiporter subunit E [Gammaproteobacteria bacterium]|nr:Na+/H+ antiporter subunit E [Gammaproteobacteria bacterium]
MVRKTLLALLLALRFLRAVVISGWQTLRVILRSRRRRPTMAIVRVGFAPMSEAGAALLGCMVSLTPGTTTIDIDMARRELLLHVLDASDTRGLLAVIRQDFEPALVTLFGTEDAA